MRTRPTIPRLALALGLLTCLLPAWGQPAGTSAGAKPLAKADAVEAAAAMERAQRLASSPLRMILEASRVRRKGEADAASEPADTAALRRTALRDESTAQASDGVAPRSAPPTTAAPGAPGDEAAAAPVPQPPLVTLAPDATLAQPLATGAPALKSEVAPQPMLALDMTPGPLPSPEMAALLVQPKLVAMTPPDIPQRVIDQVGRIDAVAAELTIRPDGSVADVAVLPPAPRAMHRAIIDALLQWRFEPLPGERKHRVELVFGREG